MYLPFNPDQISIMEFLSLVPIQVKKKFMCDANTICLGVTIFGACLALCYNFLYAESRHHDFAQGT